jgi:GTP-binding protein
MKRVRETRAYIIDDLPTKVGYEVAFIGRSNVGKSSLINALLKINTAQVSQKPGSTLWIGVHQLGPVTLVDLPGYGYARTAKSHGETVSKLVFDYLRLKRVDAFFILVDMRRGMMDIDNKIIETIMQYNCTRIILVGTKSDKKDAIRGDFDFCCSSHDGSGVDELRSFMVSLGN